MNTFNLNNGIHIPTIGFGVFMVPNDGPTEAAVSKAIKSGYRLIDTAAAYFNETDVGKAIRNSGIKREEIFVTSKLWMQDYGYEEAKKGIDQSLKNLGLDYIDLYLLHQPYGDTAGAWQALEEAVDAGKIRSIGISNYTIKFLKELIPKMRILPAVNQMECNPMFQQKELRKFMGSYGIRLEAWYPLGHGDELLMNDSRLIRLADKYHKSVAQIILRWHLQEGILAIPKATSEEHIEANIDIFDFVLTDAEMAEIRSMDTGKGTHDPEDMDNVERLRVYRVHD
ncbi:MAG: aldo/keto reductase [Dysgonomonas sp.]